MLAPGSAPETIVSIPVGPSEVLDRNSRRPSSWRSGDGDPDAGKFTFEEHAEHWRTLQVHRGNTEEQVDVVLEIRT